jgi:small-conductance mechanosensitive channel
MLELLQRQFLGNSIGRWLGAVAVGLLLVVVVRLALSLVVRRVKKISERTKIDWDDVVVAGLENTKWFSYLAAGFYGGSQLLTLSERLLDRVDRIAGVLLLLHLGFWAHVWASIILAVLSTLGVKITALIAGLGVGGVAAALAVQTLLADVIASLSIYFDRPFDIGEFIVTSDGVGTVQRISMRSTRVRALGGEELIFSNGDLLRKTIRNFGRMQERRIVFEVGVEYGTPTEKLRALPGILGEIVSSTPDTRLDRAHFKEFGAFALVFEVVYYVLSPDYTLFMDRQQSINFTIAERFEEIGLSMAFPTQTIMLRHDEVSSAPAKVSPPFAPPQKSPA